MATLTFRPDSTDGSDTYGNGHPFFDEGVNCALNEMLLGWEKSGPNQFPYRCFIKMDISSIAAGTEITSATLSMWLDTVFNTGAEPCKVRRITSDWVCPHTSWNKRDSGIDWDTPGGDFTTVDEVDFNLPQTEGASFDITITDLVKDAIDNRAGILSILLMRVTEGNPKANIKLVTSESSFTFRPNLTVVTVDP